MNTTENKHFSLDFWLNAFGSVLEVDILYVYLLTPLALVSFCFNLTSFVVLLKSSFSISSFYKYMRVYSLNSTLISLVVLTTFTNRTHRIFSFTNTYPALIFGVYIKNPLESILYLYSSLLEIFLIIERLLYFFPCHLKKLEFIGYSKFLIFLFALSALINVPLFFLLEPTHADVKVSTDAWYRIHYYGITSFSQTPTGETVSYLFYFTRDLLTLAIKLILNISTIVLVKQYASKIKKEKFEFAIKISTSILHAENVQPVKNRLISKTERNQTYMAIIMCFFSLTKHVLFLTAYLTYFIGCLTTSTYLYYFALLSLTFKHGSNIFVFSKFNHLFRAQIKKCFRVSLN